MLRATPQLYAHPRPCSGSISSMGSPHWLSPEHKRTHIGVCSLDTNRRTVLARILLDGSATLDAARAAIGHGAAIRPADLRVPALVMLVLHPCQQAASHLPCTRPPDRLSPGHGLRHFRRSFTVLSATAPSSSRLRAHPSCWFTTSDALPAALGLRAAFIRRTTSSPSVSCHLRRVAYPEGTPPCLSTGNFYFLTLADIFSPEYFLPLCYRTPPYYWERTLSVCIMHLYSVFCL